MQTADFLARVWPTRGIYFIVEATETFKKHHRFDSPEAAGKAVASMDAQGTTVYHALASYKEKFIEVPDATKPRGVRRTYRTKENVALLRAMWLDLDVGEGKDYTTQTEAVSALAKFIKTVNIASPSIVVSSGRGVHVYWCFTADLQLAEWERAAIVLKQLCQATDFKADPARTADACSILRPVGTTNRKGEPLPVRALGAGKDVDFVEFSAQMRTWADATGMVIQYPTQRRSDVNSDLILQREFPPASAHQVAKSCAQIRNLAAARGNVSEPLWYAGIGVLRFTTESPDIIHEWSSGHPGYDQHATTQKVSQHERSGVGPTTCERFRTLAPEGCNGCPFAGKVTTPLQLGTVVEPAPPPKVEIGSGVEDLPPPPWPYLRTADGKLAVEDNGEVKVFCDCDVYPVRRLEDTAVEKESVVLRVNRGLDGVRELTLDAGLINKSSEFGSWLPSKGIYIHTTQVKIMQAYLLKYMAELRRQTALGQLHKQLGWKDDNTKFVWGSSIFSADGTRVDNAAGIAALKWFHRRGELAEWQRVMRLYSRPHMEPYQFAIGAGFGAPLMPFSGYEGAIVAMVSPEGGQGKTTALHGINSIWGHPKELGLQPRDTVNAMFQRIGSYANMPVTLDELSNASGQQVSDLAYQITQGREKRRLNADASEKEQQAQWSTILTVTANQSLLGRLTLYKTNSDAEAHRIFEYPVLSPRVISKQEAEEHFPLLFEHYGVAGEVYAAWLVQNVPVIKETIKKIRQRIDKAADIQPKERYWSAVAASILTGVSSANKLGLIQFDLRKLFDWTIAMIANMRGRVGEITRSAASILGAYLNEHMGGRLVVTQTKTGWTPQNDFRGRELVYREEQGANGRIYLDRAHFRTWVTTNGGDYGAIVSDLHRGGVLLRDDVHKSLGQGTEYTTAVTTCLELDRNHKMLSGHAALKVVEPVAKIGDAKHG